MASCRERIESDAPCDGRVAPRAARVLVVVMSSCTGATFTPEADIPGGLIIPLIYVVLTNLTIYGLLCVGDTVFDPFGDDFEDFAILHLVAPPTPRLPAPQPRTTRRLPTTSLTQLRSRSLAPLRYLSAQVEHTAIASYESMYCEEDEPSEKCLPASFRTRALLLAAAAAPAQHLPHMAAPCAYAGTSATGTPSTTASSDGTRREGACTPRPTTPRGTASPPRVRAAWSQSTLRAAASTAHDPSERPPRAPSPHDPPATGRGNRAGRVTADVDFLR